MRRITAHHQGDICLLSKMQFRLFHQSFCRHLLSVGEHVRAKRQLDVQNRRFDFLSESRLKSNFIDFFEDEASKRAGSANWRMSVNYFKEFVGEVFTFTHLNETFCEEYADFLLSAPGIGRAKRKIKNNTAVTSLNLKAL